MKLVGTGLLLLLLSGSTYTQEKIRIYIDDSTSWEFNGRVGGIREVLGGKMNGGARPQTAEIVKTFNERCPAFTVTNKEENANYTVVLQHEGGKKAIRRDNKFAVYHKNGDAIASGSTRSLGNAVKDVCQAIEKDLRSNSAKPTTAAN